MEPFHPINFNWVFGVSLSGWYNAFVKTIMTLVEQAQLKSFDKPGDDSGFGRGPMQERLLKYRFDLALQCALFSSSDAPTLDVGCGHCKLTQSLAECGIPCVGIDIAENQLHTAKDVRDMKDYELPEDFTVARANELPFRNKSFSSVFAFEIFEHLMPNDGRTMLREINRALEPGGHLILSTPNANSLGKRALRSLGIFQQRDDHFNETTLPKLKSVLEEENFQILNAWGVGLIPGLWTIQQKLPLPLLDEWNIRKAAHNHPEIASSLYIEAQKVNV